MGVVRLRGDRGGNDREKKISAQICQIVYKAVPPDDRQGPKGMLGREKGRERKGIFNDTMVALFSLDDPEGNPKYTGATTSNGDLGGAGDEKCIVRL